MAACRSAGFCSGPLKKKVFKPGSIEQGDKFKARGFRFSFLVSRQAGPPEKSRQGCGLMATVSAGETDVGFCVIFAAEAVNRVGVFHAAPPRRCTRWRGVRFLDASTKLTNCSVEMPHAVKRRAICVALRIALLLGVSGLGLAGCGSFRPPVVSASFSILGIRLEYPNLVQKYC